ncbi:hypothetical protein B0H19DRAFT_1241006 [Mycena capillaripes]|nr:hypothetical protein B0H19DRAFT_1241006 [Mycena capillaripes]
MSSDDELLQLVADSRLTGYLASAALCVLLYDYFSCIPEEVELMWKSRWGIAKIIYLWNRYFSVLVIGLNASVIVRDISSSQSYVSNFLPLQLNNAAIESCVGWLQVQGSSSTVLIATVDFVLMLRVWILYGRPQWMMFFFACLGMCEVVVMIIVDVFAFRQMRDYIHLGSIIKGCYAYNVPRFLNLYAAAPLIVTFIMFVMTLYKCIRTLYSADHRVMTVWKLFLRDGVVWFVFVFAAGGSELLIWTMRRETLKQVLVVPALVVYSSVSSHTLLNIKMLRVSEQPELQINENGRGPSKPVVFVSGSP